MNQTVEDEDSSLQSETVDDAAINEGTTKWFKSWITVLFTRGSSRKPPEPPITASRGLEGGPDASGEETANFRERLKTWVATLLSRGSSLTQSESQIVSIQEFELQQDVITEMGLNSTNPSVSSIALQSMAAFHTFPKDYTLRFSPVLIHKLLEQFRGCFQRDGSPWEFRMIAPMPLSERFARAALLFPDIESFSDIFRISLFSPPQDLRSAAILVCAREADRFGIFKENFASSGTEYLLATTPILVSETMPWHLHLFRETADDGPLYPPSDSHSRREAIATLLKMLTSGGERLNLQEDVLIRNLYRGNAFSVPGRVGLHSSDSSKVENDLVCWLMILVVLI